MKLAASNIAWPAALDDDAAAVMREAGAIAVEIAPTRSFPGFPAKDVPREELAAERRRWQERALPVASMQSLLFGRTDLQLLGGAGQLSELRAHFARVLAIAQAMGCGPLVFGSPKNRIRGDLSLAEAMGRARTAFRTLAEMAAERGCTLCIEPNARAYHCDFVNTLDEAADVVAAVDHPGFGLHADTGNMALEGDDEHTLERVMPLVRHVHASAPMLAPLGDAEPLLRCVFQVLASNGYSGYVTLEQRTADGDPVAAVAASLAAIARALPP